MLRSFALPLLTLLIAFASGPVLCAQDAAPETAPETELLPTVEADGESEAQALDRSAPPRTQEEAIELDLSSLREGLEGLSTEALGEHLSAWMTLVSASNAAWVAAVAPGADPTASITTKGVVRDALVQGLDVVAQVVTENGGDAQSAFAVLATLRHEALEGSAAAFPVPSSETVAEQMPVEILRASLRPLTRAQLEVQLAGWLDLLRAKCLSVRNVEIGALESHTSDEIELFNAHAVRLRAERAHLIERVSAVIDSLEEKGGDVEEARAYIESVVQAPPITRGRALITTAEAWLTSADGGGALALSTFKAIVTLTLAWLLASVISRLVRRGMNRMHKASDLLRNFVVRSSRRVVIIFGLLVALAQIGVDMTPMLAAIGAAGLVVGLALQGTLSNFASGLLIMTNRPFDVGDLVSTSGVDGFVRGMTLLSTRIETFDERTIYIPNNKVWSDTITNLTASPQRRVDMVFGIAYEDDFRRAQALLKKIVLAHPKVLKDPEPIIRLHELADSSVNLIVRPWAMNEDYWDVYWDITETVKERFDAEDISIPFPQRDVHMIPVEAAPLASNVSPAQRPDKDAAPST